MNYLGTNGVRNMPAHAIELAVSVVLRVPHLWNDTNLLDCLNYKLHDGARSLKPVVICTEQRHVGKDTEYYVQLQNPDDRIVLLGLSGTKIDYKGTPIWPLITPWNRSSSAKSSHKSDRYSNSNSLKHHQHQESFHKSNWQNIDENSGKNVRDSDGNYRPSKRPRVPTSPAEITNGKMHLSSKQPRWSDNVCLVFVSQLPAEMSRQEFCSFVNSFMKKARLFDGNAVMDSKCIGKSLRTCILLCFSGDAAQDVVDELSDVVIKGVKLTLRRHDHFQKQGHAANDRTDKIAPNTIRQVSRETSPNTLSVEAVNDSVNTSKAAADIDSAQLEARNENLTKQVLKLLKENKDLKKKNEKLIKEVASGKQEVIDDYDRRLNDIHDSWKDQSIQIQEQEETVKSLKARQEKQAAENEKLNSQLAKMKTKYQEMTDALTRSSVVIQEEMAVRKSMALSLVDLRKAKKRAEKKLKSYLSLSKGGGMKAEDKQYDA